MGDEHRSRADLPLGSPFASVEANAKLYHALPAVMGFALERLGARYPELDGSVAARFLAEALVVLVEVPEMVLSHELGHYRAADALGLDPSVELTGWASGLTHYRRKPSTPLTPEDRGRTSAAGVNQEEMNALDGLVAWARSGGARWPEALGYLLAQTNLALYAVRTSLRQASGNIESSDDIAAYLEALDARGVHVAPADLAALGAIADLASAPVWAAIVAQIRFLLQGEEVTRLPALNVGGLNVTLPSFSVLADPQGPVVFGTTIVSRPGATPVEITIGARVAGPAAVSAGVKLHDLPLAPNLTVSPFVRGTYDSARGAGVALGAEVEAKLTDRVSLTGTTTFAKNDLLREASGERDDVTAMIGVKIDL